MYRLRLLVCLISLMALKLQLSAYDKHVADQKIVISQFNYALHLDSGDNVPIDKSFAAHCYKLMINQGNVNVQYNYAIFRSTGNSISINISLVAQSCEFAT
jgi:TPR repeat protein